MTTSEIVVAFDARSAGRSKWTARCPSHDDRKPSLTLAEGRDGRTLVRCWAGCSTEAVMLAAGLTVKDLFDRDGTQNTSQPQARANVAEVYSALAVEEQCYRERHGIDGSLLAREVNAIRARIASRYRIELASMPRPLWEGAGYGGRERDPAWPVLFDWAICVASVRLLGRPIAFGETLSPPKAVLIEAEELAAAAMRSLERDARYPQREAAA